MVREGLPYSLRVIRSDTAAFIGGRPSRVSHHDGCSACPSPHTVENEPNHHELVVLTNRILWEAIDPVRSALERAAMYQHLKRLLVDARFDSLPSIYETMLLGRNPYCTKHP